MYGNQEEIGKALQKLFSEGVIKREDIWITSKASSALAAMYLMTLCHYSDPARSACVVWSHFLSVCPTRAVSHTLLACCVHLHTVLRSCKALLGSDAPS